MSGQLASADELIDRAQAQTGLSDFGEGSWREGLDRLVGALAAQVFLPGAVERIESRLTRVLASRLEVEDWIASHPGDMAEEVEGPVIILGLPRTSTTALLNLLASDGRWRYVRAWESEQPIPPPEVASEDGDPRVQREREQLSGDTTFAGMHIHDAGGPVDDASLLRLGFRNQELGLPALDYTRWWRDCDMTATYAYHHKMLRLLQSRRPPRHWLIKAPWHNFHLEQLAAEYPGAHFVVTHRDPVKTIPSVASLVVRAFTTYQPEAAVDRLAVGRFLLEHLQISVRRLMAFRDQHGDDTFIDLPHGAFTADPIAEVERIYAGMGLTLDDAARGRLAAWSAANRAGSRGQHHYRAADFGLSEGEIADAFRSYTDRYEVG